MSQRTKTADKPSAATPASLARRKFINSVAAAAVSAWDGQLRTEEEVNADLARAVGDADTPGAST